MKPVAETPTEPAHYAALSATYGAVLAGLAASARKREAIPSRELVPLALASFALTKLLVREKAETWVRRPFVHETGGEPQPRGEGMRYAIGELLSCTRCTGAWTSLALVGLRLHSPAAGRAVTVVLATSAGNDFLQAGFKWVCRVSDGEKRHASARDSDREANGADRGVDRHRAAG